MRLSLTSDMVCRQSIASSGKEVIDKTDAAKPDLIIVDIVFSRKGDGIEALRPIHERLDIPVIYFAAHRNVLIFTWLREAPYLIVITCSDRFIHVDRETINMHKTERDYRALRWSV